MFLIMIMSTSCVLYQCNLPDPYSLCDYATVPGCASGYM